MSEHPELPELREAVRHCLLGPNETRKRMLDALIAPAGPVGKLQAERDGAVDQWIMAEQEITRLQAQLADPERIRREAIGAWVLAHDEYEKPWGWTPDELMAFRRSALAAGESAVTGEAT